MQGMACCFIFYFLFAFISAKSDLFKTLVQEKIEGITSKDGISSVPIDASVENDEVRNLHQLVIIFEYRIIPIKRPGHLCKSF